MKDRGFVPFDVASLPKLQTKHLLGIRDRLLRLEESMAASDLEPFEIAADRVYFKSDPRWALLYAAVINELSRRDHLPSGAERALRRSGQSQRTSGDRLRRRRK